MPLPRHTYLVWKSLVISDKVDYCEQLEAPDLLLMGFH
jgi:hypothetical protein